MKTAIVHEWFDTYAGSERCVESFLNIFNDADLFALVDFMSQEERKTFLGNRKVYTSFIQNLPFAKKHYRSYLPLFPLAIEQFDLTNYDLIISSYHSVSKGVLTSADQLHICYCHTPIRYAWDLYHQYIREEKLNKGLKGYLAQFFLHKIRIWDYTTVNRVNYFIANSNYIARKINKIYGRPAKVIYPPVDIDKFELCTSKDNYYLTASRFVPYKKIDLIVEAFAQMPDKKLLVIGNGPDEKKVKAKAGSNIEFLGYQSTDSLKQYMKKAKAFVFAAIEDFGITVVEALSCGTPVIALGKGGTAETVINGKTGINFNEQTVSSLCEAVLKFEKSTDKFDPHMLRNFSESFSRKNFEENIFNFINDKYQDFYKKPLNKND